MVKASLSLLGNAATHFSTESRKAVMKHLNKDLKPLAEAELPKRGAFLFGDKKESPYPQTQTIQLPVRAALPHPPVSEQFGGLHPTMCAGHQTWISQSPTPYSHT